MKKIVVLDDGYTITYDPDGGVFEYKKNGLNQGIPNQTELFYRLFRELLKAQHSLFECPDCGYKITYQEFTSQE